MVTVAAVVGAADAVAAVSGTTSTARDAGAATAAPIPDAVLRRASPSARLPSRAAMASAGAVPTAAASPARADGVIEGSAVRASRGTSLNPARPARGLPSAESPAGKGGARSASRDATSRGASPGVTNRVATSRDATSRVRAAKIARAALRPRAHRERAASGPASTRARSGASARNGRHRLHRLRRLRRGARSDHRSTGRASAPGSSLVPPTSMSLGAVLAALPEGYELLRGRRGWLACERGARATLLAAGFGPDGGEVLRPSDLAGRAPLGAIEAEGERWIVRRFHHGGLLRALGERLYLAPARPFRELAFSHALREMGLSTPRVVAARCVRAAPCGWRLALVSARIEGTSHGGEVLERLRRGALAHAARRRFLATLGELVGRLHAARFVHADLNPHNLLVSADLASGWVLDLDRGRFVRALSAPARRDNLRRLYRFVRRRESGASSLTRGDYLRFLRAYCRRLGPDADWRADWRAILRRDRLRGPAHRVGWWLEELLGDGPERRDARRPA